MRRLRFELNFHNGTCCQCLICDHQDKITKVKCLRKIYVSFLKAVAIKTVRWRRDADLTSWRGRQLNFQLNDRLTDTSADFPKKKHDTRHITCSSTSFLIMKSLRTKITRTWWQLVKVSILKQATDQNFLLLRKTLLLVLYIGLISLFINQEIEPKRP